MPRTTKKRCYVTSFAKPLQIQNVGGSFVTRVSSSQLFDHLFVFGKWGAELRELPGLRSLSPSIRDIAAVLQDNNNHIYPEEAVMKQL